MQISARKYKDEQGEEMILIEWGGWFPCRMTREEAINWAAGLLNFANESWEGAKTEKKGNNAR